jgi:tight adherence protein C
VGIGIVLRTQSIHLRTRRRQRAQEAALKAPIKMLFPLVFFIFPAMFVVTLGPAVLRVIDTFAKPGL